MKRFILLFFLLISISVFSVQISQNEAETVATNWLSSEQNLSSINFTNIEVFKVENNTSFYFFTIESGGYIIVSAIDTTEPIIAYSISKGDKLNLENLNPILSEYVPQIERIRNDNSIDRNQLWDALLDGTFIPNQDRDVDPLVQSVWGTGNPWNDDFPWDPDGDGNRVDIGSTAVSLGMVMKYWNHPANGTGQHSYIHSVYGEQFADFENTLYDWSRMPNTFPYNATRILLEHCAIAIDTNYGPYNSYASQESSSNALKDYFQYAQSAEFIVKNDYTNAQWKEILHSELDQERPVLYSGMDGDNEIGFICDGYQGENYFHFNWGREGVDNGFYLLSSLNPGEDDFTSDQAAVIGIEPTLGPITIDENFENEFNDFNWYFGEDEPWAVVPEEHYFGTHSAKSGGINHNQQSILQIDINVYQDGEISFFRKVSCEDDGANNYDYLTFYIDNAEIERWGGEREWEFMNYPVEAGVHNFKWAYEKDGSYIDGQDCAWVDAIDFPEGGIAVHPPQNLTAELLGFNNIQLNWEMPIPDENNTQLGYEIYCNGVSISSINNPEITGYFDQMLSNGSYQYFVKAVYLEGYSNPSNAVSLEIEVPYAPQNLITFVNDDDVTLEWNMPPANSRNRALSGYKVYRDEEEIATIPNAQTTVYADNDLPTGTYYYFIKAIYSEELSEPSNIAVAAVGVPNPPLYLNAAVYDENSVELVWQTPQSSQYF